VYEYRATITRVIDGDTYEVEIDLGFFVTLKRQRVRLLGVDTPEVFGRNRDEVRGPAATTFVALWVDACGGSVVLKTHKALKKSGDEKQSLDRWIAEVFNPDGESLAEAIIEAGHVK
jgi:micrococcal nuclease